MCGGLYSAPLSARESEGPGHRLCRSCGLAFDPRVVTDPALGMLPETVAARRGLHDELLSLIQDRSPSGTLLDVGCGAGGFLSQATLYGWRVHGIEPYLDSRIIARRRGHPVLGSPLSRSGLHRDRFDAVTFWDCLDCMDDPTAELDAAFRVLKPGGAVWIRVRNAPFSFSLWRWGRRLGLERFASLAVIHRNGFNKKSLDILLRQRGFDDVEFLPSPSADVSAYTGGFGLLGQVLIRLGRFAGLTALLVRAKKTSRVRVLHLITRLDPGGSAEAALDLARGSERDILAAGPGQTSPPEWAVTIPHLVRDVSPLHDLLAFWGILKLLDRERPSVLHTHTSKAGFIGRWTAWLLNKTRRRRDPIRIIHSAYGHVLYGYFSKPMSRLFQAIEAATARITDLMVAISEGEMTESLDFGIGRREQWQVVPLGADLKGGITVGRLDRRGRARWGIAEEDIVIGTIARLEPVKGVETLVDSAALLCSENPGVALRFLIIGDGSLRLRLEERSRLAGLEDRIIFAGHCDDIQECLSAMDIYTQPSLNEGMGKALLMAQAAGLPAVASRVCGIPDVVEEGRSALLVRSGRPRELADGLARLVLDPGLRARLAQGARAAALRPDGTGTHFSSGRMSERLEAVYTSFLRK